MSFDRRQLIGRTAVAGAGLAATATGIAAVTAAPAEAKTRGSRDKAQDLSKLFPPLRNDPDGLLALPRGFRYQLVAVSGKTDIHDGTGRVIGKSPDRPDGTGAFRSGNRFRLVQNHECRPGVEFPVPLVEGTVYDRGALGGGCTIIETNRGGRRISEWVGLSGTYSNCAGGVTPWGAWLTCEETEVRAGTGSLEKDHGYIFDVSTGTPSDQSPLPIKAWGRAAWEAVVVAPTRDRVHITEDTSRPNGLLYRWTAPPGYRLRPQIARALGDNAGRLEAMQVLTNDGSILPDLAYVTAAQIGRPFATRWKRVPDRQATTTSLRNQFGDDEITRSKKLEGAWGDRRGMYFAASFASGESDLPANATKHDGQIWYYDYRDETLTLVAYFPYNEILHADPPGWEDDLGPSLDLAFDGPDNVHVSPYGSLVLAEDGDTAQHLISWTAETGAQAIARNQIVAEQSDAGGNVYAEMTGPTFSPDGVVLFGNVQEPGHSFAIRGPWRRYLG